MDRMIATSEEEEEWVTVVTIFNISLILQYKVWNVRTQLWCGEPDDVLGT